ncbi:cation acetate symporter, partial [Streptomyces sp. NPDC006875]
DHGAQLGRVPVGAQVLEVAATMAGYPGSGALHALLAWPALWSVPLGFLTMILVSLATPGRVPQGTAAILARFHLPEELADGQVHAAGHTKEAQV